MKISFFCIALNEEKNIGKMLDTVKDYVDEIIVVDTGSTDDTKKIAEEHGAKVYDFEWCDDFSAARNFAQKKCTYPIIFWMDCDDELIHGDRMREAAEEIFQDPRNGGGFMVYQYAFDDYGHCAMEHWKLRLFRRDGFKWIGRVHENAHQIWECGFKKISESWIKHNKTVDEVQGSSDRNLRILLKELEDTGEDNLDPRTAYYLGNTYHGLKRDDEAIKYFELHQKTSGWDEEKYVGLTTMASCYIRKHEFNNAIDTFLRAMKLLPDWPDAYHGIAQCYLSLKAYKKVEQWTKMGLQKQTPDSQVLINPRKYDLYPMICLEDAYVQQGKFAEALPIQISILKFLPDHEEYTRRFEYCQSCIRDNRMVSYIRALKNKLEEDGEDEKLHHLAMAVPEQYEDMPSMRRLQTYKSNDDREQICIFCGPSHEFWSPKNIETGLGGSEEAVVNMGKELTKLGYLVTVYSFLPVGEEGEYDGVMYKNFWEISADIKRIHWKAVVLWRNPSLVQGEWNTDKLYVWLHDMQEQVYYDPEWIKKADKFFVLSEWHRKNVHFIPDDKICISSNGIDVSHFEKDLERNPHRVIYSSSPDRGLDNLLSCWDAIKKEVPKAELHIYYGFTPVWDAMYHDNQKMMNYKRDLMDLIKSHEKNGVIYHGRVGHRELADAMLHSGIWAYPTSFPEISCITAMKCQAAGAIPVTSSYAAINETIQYGDKLPTPVDVPVMHEEEWRQSFTDAMIFALQDHEWQKKTREKMVPWAREHFKWKHVAKQWSDLFRGEEVKHGLKYESNTPASI